MSNPFLNIRPKNTDEQKSLSWYQDQVKTLGNIKPNKLMSNTPELVNTVLPGGMYMFFYDAKFKDVLPYWDMFPLVLPFKKVEDGFYGINLHYLPYGLRFKLLGALHNYATDEKIIESTRIRINWQILSSLSRAAPVKNCTKHYLNDHIKSKFLKIKYPDWITASLLPVEKFVGANKAKVWSETKARG